MNSNVTRNNKDQTLQKYLIYHINPAMTVLNSKPPVSLCLALAMSLAFCVFTMACKQPPAPAETTSTEAEESDASLAQRQAEKVIENDPNVELVEVQGDMLLIQNKHTKRTLTLPFQMIIDGHYPMIQEDKAMAERILAIQKANNKGAAKSPASTKAAAWKKTPNWIPRYPGLEIEPSQMHIPQEDGTIWGYLRGTHSDTLEKVRANLISAFKKTDLKLTRKMVEKNSSVMIFDNSHLIENETQEKRRVTCSITRRGELTHLAIQYSYGM